MRNEPPFFLQVWATIAITAWVFYYALVIRLMGPRLEGFLEIGLPGFLFVFAPAILLLVVWGVKRGAKIALVLCATGFILAHLIGSYEEYRFVQKHKETGIGPTARSLQSSSWLAYNAETGELSGSD